ncbi:MAG: AAA-like domain-containing protein [Spirulina sp.]
MTLCSDRVSPLLNSPMTREEFDDCLETLTPGQKKILWLFLDDKTIAEIAATLICGQPNVRRHISNICKAFGYSNGDGEFYSYRNDLVEDFLQHLPEKVGPGWKEKLGTQAEQPDFPGRPFTVDSRFYINRPLAERKALRISDPAALVRIRGPRRTGKTSLLNRMIHSAQAQQYYTAIVGLYKPESDILQDLERFLHWFCLQVSEKVGLPPNLEDYWSTQQGHTSSCSSYLQRYILRNLDQPLVVAIDEADRLFEYPQTAQAFFRLVRGWSEEGKVSEVWQNLRQVMVYATDVYIDLGGYYGSPFNVGTAITLLPLSLSQIQTLAQQYGLFQFTGADAQTLMDLVAGHPYLVQLALYSLHQDSNLSMAELAKVATSPTQIYGNHLRTLTGKLGNAPDLASAFDAVIAAQGKPIAMDDTTAKKLEGMGLVTRQNDTVTVSCQLYQRYFQGRLLG